jgi:hypothetical protein
MAEPEICRGCGRRLRFPAAFDRAQARCPKCLTPVDAAPAPANAYQNFQKQQAAPETPPPAKAPDPQPEIPFRVPAQVTADTLRQFHGPMHAVFTPLGLFLELHPNHPFLFAPVGTHCRANGATLSLILPGRLLDVHIAAAVEPEQLTADTAAFLTGQRPVPRRGEYGGRPWWLVGVGAIFAVGLGAGPVLLASVSDDLPMLPAVAVSAALMILALLANAGIALFGTLPTGAKIGAMAILNAALLGLFLAGAMAFLRDDSAPPPPPVLPVPEPVEEPPAPPPPPAPRGPDTHYDVFIREGKARLSDGPAEVTALTIMPPNDGVLVAYANGTTRIWQFNEPVFEAPHLGPRMPSAVRRVAHEPDGKRVTFTCDTGLVIASLDPPGRAMLFIPGEHATAFYEPNRDRFAAIRNDRVHVRYIPMNLLSDPPLIRVKSGIVVSTPQDETLPLGMPPTGFNFLTGGKPTFLAWRSDGGLLAGRADGTINTMNTAKAAKIATPFVGPNHRSPVRAWERGPNGELAFGDDDGFVGILSKSGRWKKFRTGGVAVRTIAFNPCGGEVAVLDDSGWVSLWDPETGTKLLELRQRQPVNAIAYGPRDDILMLADGAGVDVWWRPELLAAPK